MTDGPSLAVGDATLSQRVADLVARRVCGLSCTSGRRQQAPDLLDRCGASRRRLGALNDEMVVEELLVLVMLMKVLRRQNGRYHRDFGVQLNPHQPADNGFSDELVPVNAAIDDEPGGNDGGIAPALGEQQRVQRNLQRSGHLEEVNVALAEAVFGDFGSERHAASIDDVLVPAGLYKGDRSRIGGAGGGLVLALIHGCSSS